MASGVSWRGHILNYELLAIASPPEYALHVSNGLSSHANLRSLVSMREGILYWAAGKSIPV